MEKILLMEDEEEIFEEEPEIHSCISQNSILAELS